MSVTIGMACWVSGWIVGLGCGIWITRRAFLAKIRGYQEATYSGPARRRKNQAKPRGDKP